MAEKECAVPKKYKIIEWNINMRSGIKGKGSTVPDFVMDEIKDQNADIVILTEFFNCIPGMAFLHNTFTENDYDYAITENAGTNEVVIGWKKDSFTKKYVDSTAVTTMDNNIPNYLRVDLEDKTRQILTVIGSRIRIVDYTDRKLEMDFILQKAGHVENSVIIAGDFNNNRRLTVEKNWNLKVIDEMLETHGFVRRTPEGQSIYEEKKEYAYEFPEDHFMTRDVIIEDETYDRDFVYRAPLRYPWGKNFKTYDPDTKRIRMIGTCNPDHAILKGWFQF